MTGWGGGPFGGGGSPAGVPAGFQTDAVHPYWLTWMHVLFTESIAIQVNSPITDTFGQRVENWIATPFTAIAAAVRPVYVTEVENNTKTIELGTYTAVLYGMFPAITPLHRAILWGRPFNITAAFPSAFAMFTSLGLKEVI